MSDTQARYVLQQQLEELFNKNQTFTRIAKEFKDCEEFDFIAYMEHNNINVRFGLDLLVQMALHKRCSFDTLFGLLRHHFDVPQHVADEMLKCVTANLVAWNTATRQFIVVFTITQEVQNDLDRYQYPLPMVVQPNHLKNNRSSGYLIGESSVILKNNHHDQDVCLDHLNRCNKVKYCIDLRTASMVKNSWRNLDRAKNGESREEFEKRKKAFEKYDRTAHDVLKLLLQEGNEFYLTHRYDKRGRTYCQGYHVNYQGAAWNKAVINFADKEITHV